MVGIYDDDEGVLKVWCWPVVYQTLYGENQNVIDIAYWVYFALEWIHPFCDGNGCFGKLLIALLTHDYHA